MLSELQIGDIVRMRKQHPCGGWLWEVTRLGADIGLQCQSCQRRILLSRRELNRRAKCITSPSTLKSAPVDGEGPQTEALSSG